MSVRKKIVMTKGEPVTYWIADYKDGSGIRHQRRFGTKKEATTFIEPIKVAVRAGTHVSIAADLTMADAADKWLARLEAKGRERGTLKTSREHINLHILPRVGSALKLAKLTKTQVENFCDGLLSGVKHKGSDGKEQILHKPLSRPTAHKVLVSLKAILKVNGCKHLADDVSITVSKRDRPKLEVGRDIPTPKEVSRLVNAATGRVRVLLMMAASTGLRASELRGLRWSDVDLKEGELHVRQRADAWKVIGAPKSDGSRRTLPLAHDLVIALKEWRLACPKGEADLVFPAANGAVVHHKVMLEDVFKVMRAAHVVTKGGRPKYGLHGFRHFFASWCINAESKGGRELPAKEVQSLLGHSSIVMTLDRYGHLFPSGSDRAELNRSASALFG